MDIKDSTSMTDKTMTDKTGCFQRLLVVCYLFHRSIRQCPEVGKYFRRFWRIHHALREQDTNHFFLRINVGSCAETTSPTETVWIMIDFLASYIYRKS